jgi:hypothetical protein
MLDYSNAKIYTIRFIDNDNNIYIGSTIQPLAVRFGGHKKVVSSLYEYIQDVYNGDWSKCYIELYECFKCNNKEQLNKREGEVIRDFMKNNEYKVINKRIEGRTRKEYIQDNKEILKKKYKEYYENNKDKIKEYYSHNKDKIKEYIKEYYSHNKDKIKEYIKEYDKKTYNKEENTERMRDYRARIRIYNFLMLIKDL